MSHTWGVPVFETMNIFLRWNTWTKLFGIISHVSFFSVTYSDFKKVILFSLCLNLVFYLELILSLVGYLNESFSEKKNLISVIAQSYQVCNWVIYIQVQNSLRFLFFNFLLSSCQCIQKYTHTDTCTHIVFFFFPANNLEHLLMF